MTNEIDFHEIEFDSNSNEFHWCNHSDSNHSVKTVANIEIQCKDNTVEFMRRFVDLLFKNSSQLSLELKAEFGAKAKVTNKALY